MITNDTNEICSTLEIPSGSCSLSLGCKDIEGKLHSSKNNLT